MAIAVDVRVADHLGDLLVGALLFGSVEEGFEVVEGD